MERERRERTVCRKTEQGMLVFGQILCSIFFPLMPSNPPLFIGGGRGQSCLYWGKIPALDSVGKEKAT